MEVGQSITEIIGNHAEIVGNRGALLDSVLAAFDSTAFTLVEGMEKGARLSAGMLAGDVLGASAEIIARPESTLAPILAQVLPDTALTQKSPSPAVVSPRKPSGHKPRM